MKRFELPLLFAIFLDLVGFGITFPDVQLRAQDYGAPGWQIGAILASYYLVQMIVSPRWGRFSDRIWRRPVLLLCGGISAASMVCYALAHNLWWLLAARLLAGVGAANVVIAQAYIADVASPEDRPQALGRMSATVSAGLVLGPVIGGFLANAGGNFLLGMVAAAASALGALWILLAVPAHPPVVSPEAPPQRRAFALVRDTPSLLRLFLVALTGWFALACLEGTFGRLIQHTLGLGRAEFGILLSLEAGVSVIQGALFPFLVQRVSGEILLRASYLLQAAGLAGMPFAPSFGVLIGLSILFGLGVGIAGPTINGRASDLTPPERQGEVFGFLQSSRALGFLIGPILGGALFDRHAEFPYLLAGGVMVFAALTSSPGAPQRNTKQEDRPTG